MKKIKGIGISKGLVMGNVFLYSPVSLNKTEKSLLTPDEEEEILTISIEKTEAELKELLERMKEKKESEIFSAHLLILRDPTLVERIRDLIRKENFNAASAVKIAIEKSAKMIEGLENPYMSQRAIDVRDVGEMIIRNITGKRGFSLSSLPYPAIVVAENLTPSDTASLDRENTLGFVTYGGSKTSHTAILAASLGIPATAGLKNLNLRLKNEEIAILDGENGVFIVDPDRETVQWFYKEKERRRIEEEELQRVKPLPAITRSGKRIEMSANIGNVEDCEAALKSGAEGVGLFRTEFLFLGRSSPPGEEEQLTAYRRVAEKFEGRPVIIRTLDVGGDKEISYLHLEREQNPFLGVRGIRLSLQRRDLFKTQLRAILRASAHGNIKIMYPMVTIREEIAQANGVLKEAMEELKKESIPFDENIKVGIMVEVPSTALTAEMVVDYVDFFSIGTNDLSQYTFAADRTNENLSHLCQPLVILRLIKMVVDAAHKRGKWVGVCGEMAGDTEIIPELLRIGIDELSMNPVKISKAKKVVIESE
jgi:phosphotransferase system enzyme I (PtsI)